MLEENKNESFIFKLGVNYQVNSEDYMIHFDKGKAYSKDGKLFDTTNARAMGEYGGECIYVFGMDGKLYVSDPDILKLPEFHHSSFFNGKPVKCAGSIIVKNGIIREITVTSGHYKPRPKELLNFLEQLQNTYHVNLSHISVIDKPIGSRTNALKYLNTKGFCLPENREDIRYGQINDALLNVNIAEEKGECVLTST